jgi:hypothetical protein
MGNNVANSRIAILVIVLCLVGLSCACPLGTGIPTLPAQPTALPAQPSIPAGWKLSKDSSGACQVAAPPDWQLGRDFFLQADSTDAGPFVSTPRHYPPMGLALWGVEDITHLPKGRQFQMRTSLVTGERVCSVWRIQQSNDFTEAEKSIMQQVGASLQEVR